jgi:hypothetical protein
MGLLDRLLARRLLALWEERVKPELQAELEKWPEEGTPVQSKKDEKVLLLAFMDTVERKMVVNALGVHSRRKDGKKAAAGTERR